MLMKLSSKKASQIQTANISHLNTSSENESANKTQVVSFIIDTRTIEQITRMLGLKCGKVTFTIKLQLVLYLLVIKIKKDSQ